ncbi:MULTISPECIES: murein biosynthesis integral membrane protein MurJ [Marinobacter]|uniref:Probable lipid II flippase MurJ n=1 Tax=Marinobacter profundi TaxID=2666256 RepID=A0A2G1UHF0_9GAMM|nr:MULTISPECIES: murein biosynthesis integral membrane protein MurJ [Marinobacter]MBD3657675.1 murein biosynthesis integral membrane protein MurJ [Marinobacter sp.]PHQ13936.1 murein biosynthesis integral membrane protein MurJ [Marinobacter profundi]
MSAEPEKTSGNSELPKAPGLLRSSGVVGVMTMLSRVLGLVRDMVIARYFGAGAGADAFFVAFKIPNFLRRLFAEGAFSQAFVPVLSSYREQQSVDEVRGLVNAVAGSLGLVLLGVTLVAMLGAPLLTAVFAPGFLGDDLKFALASDMLRITFPYLLLISLTAFAGGILNSYDRFAIPAFTPVLLNLAMIGAAIFLTPLMDTPVMALAWGVFIAGALQLFFQLPFLMRLGLLPRPRVDYRHEGVRRILKLMVPALFGVSVSQINLLLDTVLASFLQTGSVSWLYYSDRLSELPLGVFGIAIATVILPSLSRKHAAASADQFAATLDWAVRAVLLIGVPAAIALGLLAEPLIATLFHYGEVTDRDVAMSAQSLRAYSAGLLAFMLIKVLAPGFFAREDTSTPVKIGIIAMIANMVFNLALIFPLAHAGLALATSLSAWLNAWLLWRGLRKEGAWQSQSGWPRFLAQLVFANATLVAIILYLQPPVGQWLTAGGLQRSADMALLVAAGVGGYFVALALAGVRVRHFRQR